MEIPDIYKGLDPTDLTYKEFKPVYARVKKEILEQFPDIRINDPSLNIKVYEKIGFPFWEGKAWQMNGGARRDFGKRRATQKTAGNKRYQTTRGNLSKVKQEYFDEAGALWDELVGNPKGSFTMNGKTFNNRLHYQNWEVKRQVALDEKYQKLNKTRGKTHGHAVPPLDKRARESRLQSFAEDARGNFASRDVLPEDYDARLKKAGIPLGEDVAKQAVGTAETIGDPLPSEKIEKILKGDLYIDDITENSKVFSPKINRAKLIKLGVAGIVLPGAGSVANALEASERAKIAAETNNRLDVFQSWLSNAELTTGLIPAGEIVSTPLGVANLVIDAARYGTQPTDTSSRQRYRHGNR